MTETTRESQIRLKVGQIEVEFKGTEEFIKKELKEFVTSIADLHKSTGIIAAPVNEGPVPATLKPVSSTNGNLSDETIESLAKKLGCKNTADLVRIAAAYIVYVKGQDSFTRAELLQTMRDEGKTFFKESDVRNLNKYLDKFTKDDFFRKDGSKGFKLGPDAKKDLRQKLAV